MIKNYTTEPKHHINICRKLIKLPIITVKLIKIFNSSSFSHVLMSGKCANLLPVLFHLLNILCITNKKNIFTTVVIVLIVFASLK